MKYLRNRVGLFFCLCALLVGSGLVTSCAAPNPKKAAECSRLLSIATRELEAAKAKGLSGTVALTKATALISAAQIQLQFNKYPNCIDKAIRARRFIRMSATEK